VFITDAQLTSALSDALHRLVPNGADLMPFFSGIITRANSTAYWEIVSALMGRGFDKVQQIDLWDRGPEYQTAIGLWWCLELGAAIDSDSYRGEALTDLKLDRRKELLTAFVTITVNGICKWQDPMNTQGQVVVVPNSQGFLELHPISGDALSGAQSWDDPSQRL